MKIQIIKTPVTKDALRKIAVPQFGNVVKAVVDIKQRIMAIGGGLHADEEVALMEEGGSEREYTWGINLYPDEVGEGFIEFDSMINLKPSFGNRTRNVENVEIQEKIIAIVKELIIE